MADTLTDNSVLSRYELTVDGMIVYADYMRSGDVVKIKYVFSPPELRGTGAAGRLMQALADQARTNRQKLQPICGYAASWLKRHDEFADLVI